MADVKFEDFSIKVKEMIEEAAVAYLHAAAGEIEAQVKRNSSIDTGQLKGSWKYNIDESKYEAYVGSPLENAIWEEFGTGEYAANGDGRKGAWYVSVEGYTGKKKPTYNGRVVIVHGKNGKDYYKTNGKKPKRTLQNAFLSSKSILKKMAESIFKDKL